MRRFGILSLLLALAGSSSILACVVDPDDVADTPGHLMVGTLSANECGAGAPAVTTFSVPVTLERDGDLVGLQQESGPPVLGRINDEDEWVFTFTSALEGYAHEEWTGRARCDFEMVETVTLRVMEWESAPLDGGTNGERSDSFSEETRLPRVMEGENVTTLRALAGSDCADSLASAGGPFSALPCSVEYRLDIDATDD